MHRHSAIAATFVIAIALAACTPSTGSRATGSVTAATAPAVSPPAAGSPATDVAADIKVLDFQLDPSTVTVSGTTLTLVVTNDGPTVHNVTVRDANGNVLFGTRDLREGESETVTHAIAPGTYVLYCSLPGHESLGVKGTLTVTAP
jgi:plastocyanin